jgi:hypothetical protein
VHIRWCMDTAYSFNGDSLCVFVDGVERGLIAMIDIEDSFVVGHLRIGTCCWNVPPNCPRRFRIGWVHATIGTQAPLMMSESLSIANATPTRNWLKSKLRRLLLQRQVNV